MTESRVEKAKRNLVFGMVNKVVTMLMPFFSRTALIYVLGMEYVGLNSLVASILQVLNLADLGIGTAIVYALYEPVAKDDKPVISALMNYYRRVYRIIGIVIGLLGLAVLPFLPRLIKGEPPADVNIYILYLIYLANTVVSYLLFAYKQALPTAMQRVDVVSNVNTITNVVLNAAQIVILLAVHNYYAYLVAIPLCTLLNNLCVSRYVDRNYPEYAPKGRISNELRASIRKRVVGLTIQRVCVTTRNSFDSVFLSTFLGLTVTAIYNNYLLIMNAVTGLLGVVSTAILPTVGNSIVTDSADKNYGDMRLMNFVYMLVSGWSTACLLCLYQPFMRLWAGEQNTFGMAAVILMVLYYYSLKMGDIISIYASGAGLWWEMRWRAVAESAANLVLNFLFVRMWGVEGVIAATLISLLIINFGMATAIIFKYYFKNGKMGEYFADNLFYAVGTLLVCGISFFLCSLVPGDGIIMLLLRGVICTLVSAAVYLLVNLRNPLLKTAIRWASNLLAPHVGIQQEESR